MEYKILIKGVNSKVYLNDSLVITAKRKGRIWGDKIIFYDFKDEIFATAKSLVFFFSEKKDILFYNNWGRVRIVHKLKYQRLQIDGYELKIKNTVLGGNTSFFINEQKVGYTKDIKSSMYDYEDLMICKDEKFALIFAMVHIINGKFNIA